MQINIDTDRVVDTFNSMRDGFVSSYEQLASSAQPYMAPEYLIPAYCVVAYLGMIPAVRWMCSPQRGADTVPDAAAPIVWIFSPALFPIYLVARTIRFVAGRPNNFVARLLTGRRQDNS